MTDLIFGNENAEKDPLLRDCYVNHGPKNKQIITGRWGTGKTAHILATHKLLSETLGIINERQRRLWYLEESELNTDQIIDAFYELEPRKFQRRLKSIWIGEIYRRMAILLTTLRPIYSKTNGSNWDLVVSYSEEKAYKKTLWQQIPNALKVLKLIDGEQGNAIEGIQSSISALFSEEIKEAVQLCLVDIKEHNIQPVIAIEPIDTPFSALEGEESLAQQVISALLNVFQSDFQYTDDQLIRLIISVPWHRYTTENINLPQKLAQYDTYISWDKTRLRNFINERIKWEFKRTGRSFSTKGRQDAWDALFKSELYNKYCTPYLYESTFEYVLRHTNYRPRELQRITRNAVEICARKINKSQEYVLKGQGGVKVDGSHIREAVSNYSRRATNDLIDESKRRFHHVNDITETLKGISIPFLESTLEERLPKEIDLSTALSTLWDSGILGVEAYCCSPSHTREVIELMPSKNYKFHRNVANEELHRWYFFEYNWDGEIVELLNRYRSSDKVNLQLILHPRMFETFGVHVSNKWPIGI